MALNEGERQALIQQTEVLTDSVETKLRRLGLPYIRVGLWDERTRQPMTAKEIIAMAEEPR